MSDLISRQAAIDAMEQAKEQYFDRRVIIGKMQDVVSNLPSAQETHEERTETHACDLISRQAAIDEDEVVKFYKNMGEEVMELTVKNVHLGGKIAMTKYSEIETETAKNLLKEGYKWIARDESGGLFAYTDKPINLDTFWCSDGISNCVCYYVPIFQSIHFGDKEPTSLERIVHPQILDDVERRYLRAVIRPFRNKVLYIAKRSIMDRRKEHIYIDLTDDVITLPCFMKGTMYKGMKTDKEYTPKELGL